VDPPFVSVIVPTRDRPDTLEACLRSLLACEYDGRYEIVVVDNRPSSAPARDVVAKLDGDIPVRYTTCRLPGQAHARNQGIRESAGDPLLFTDDDVVVDAGWIAESVSGFDDPRVGCVTGRVVPLELETEAQSLLEQFGGYAKGVEPLLFDLAENRPRDPLFPYNAGRFGTGGAMAFRRRVLEELGGFAPITCEGVTLAEDLDAFLRTILLGHAIAYRPAAVVYHRHRRDYDDLRTQVRYYGMAVTALLTKTILERPSVALELARRAPAGLRYALSDSSPKNRNRSPAYPRDLKRAELGGFLVGPWAYLRDRRRSARRQA